MWTILQDNWPGHFRYKWYKKMDDHFNLTDTKKTKEKTNGKY